VAAQQRATWRSALVSYRRRARDASGAGLPAGIAAGVMRLDAQPRQRSSLRAPAAPGLVQHVAPDAEDPAGRRVAVGRVGGEAPALLEGTRVGLGDQIDGELRVVGAVGEEDEQAPPVALVGAGESVGAEALACHPPRSCRGGPML
jgi:hypothetical protein